MRVPVTGLRGLNAVTAAVVVVLLCWAAAAFACTNLATISLSSGYGRPGDKITIIGSSFPIPRAASGTAPTPVVLHWKSSEGPVLATAIPDRTGTISATFTVPPSEPGNVVIVALQRRPIVDPALPDESPRGYVDEVGTPARATFRILAPGELVPTSAPFRQSTPASGSEGSTGLIVLMVLFGSVALSLFAGGVIAFLHQVRSQRPVAQRWPPY
jgi:hypothetical protein